MGTNIPPQITHGEHVLGHSLGHPFSIYHQGGIYHCDFPSNYSGGTHTLLRAQMTTPFAQPSSILTLVRRQSCRDFQRAACLKQKDEMPFKKPLKGDWWEAFAKDSDLVQWGREDYFRTNHPPFNCETSHDLSGVFKDMITSVCLLDSQIYKKPRVLDRVGRPVLCQWCVEDFT